MEIGSHGFYGRNKANVLVEGIPSDSTSGASNSESEGAYKPEVPNMNF